ncbi:MAG: hypothetical protein MJ188_00475 [Treponema sp.]|nr:hypothetical protein [Treponema sp.]
MTEKIGFVEELNEGCSSYINYILTTLESELSEVSDVGYEKIVHSVAEKNLPSLNGIRVMDRTCENIFYSTFAFDSKSSTHNVYKRYSEIEGKTAEISSEKLRNFFSSKESSDGNVLFDRENSRMLVIYPCAVDSLKTDVVFVFYFGLNGLEQFFVNNSFVNHNDSFLMLSDSQTLQGGFVFGLKKTDEALEEKIFGWWKELETLKNSDDCNSIHLSTTNGKEYYAFSVLHKNSSNNLMVETTVFVESNLFNLPIKIFYELVAATFAALFLLFFIIFSLLGLRKKSSNQTKKNNQAKEKIYIKEARKLSSNDYLEELKSPEVQNYSEVLGTLEEIEDCNFQQEKIDSNMSLISELDKIEQNESEDLELMEEAESKWENTVEIEKETIKNQESGFIMEVMEMVSDIDSDDTLQNLPQDEPLLDIITPEPEQLAELEDVENPDDVEDLEEVEEAEELEELEDLEPADSNVSPLRPSLMNVIPPKPVYSKNSEKTFIGAESDDFATVNNVFAEDLCMGDEYVNVSTQSHETASNFVPSSLDFIPDTDLQELESLDECTENEKKDNSISKNPFFSMTTFGQSQEIISVLNADTIVETDGVYSIIEDVSYDNIVQDPDFKALVDSVLK